MRIFFTVFFVCFNLCYLSYYLHHVEAKEISNDLLINGTYYQKIVDMKDLIADILPPPRYIIESYLITMQIADELDKRGDADKARIDALFAEGKKLSEGAGGYTERHAFWEKDLQGRTPAEKSVKELMLSKSEIPAKEFFRLRDSTFMEAVKAGKRDVANKILRGELKKYYTEHREYVDQMVSISGAELTKIEKMAAEKVAAGGDKSTFALRSDLYNMVIRYKDIISDILPPPKYIIELYLTSLLAVDELELTNKKLALELLEYGKKLFEGQGQYKDRQDYWVKKLGEENAEIKNIKELMVKKSYDPAVKFYEIFSGSFSSAVKEGNITKARIVIRKELRPLYEEHRKYIDELVAAANKLFNKLEEEVASKLAAGG